MKLQITVDGRAYAVDVELLEEDEAPAGEEISYAPMAPAQAPNQAAGSDPNLALSPVNGLVIKVLVEPGQLVEAGSTVAVLEAMKMETNIVAPRRAAVKYVHVKPGDPVKAGSLLVEFEDARAGRAGESSP